jgi:tetratricopeptide (TPR) repeat protein
MAKKKTATGAVSRATKPDATPTPGSIAYDKAIAKFGEAVQLMNDGQHEAAKQAFDAIETGNPDEPVLSERARSYSLVCAGRLAPEPAAPTNAEEYYLRGVVNSNNGQFDEAIRLLDQAVAVEPASARFLYARASAFALKGDAEAAIENLRQAIANEPTTRFQAVNDPDFEQIREEPAFIDIIEPTPSGA